jgi:hypothetical protein
MVKKARYSRKSQSFSDRVAVAMHTLNPYGSDSRYSRLKAGLPEGGCFEGPDDAQLKLFNYIDDYYNTRHFHSAIGYQSPINFENGNTEAAVLPS